MDTKKCKRKECNNLIAINKRSDSLYCTTLCGARDRNEKKERADKEKRPHKRKVEVNYKIISSLFKKGAIDEYINSARTSAKVDFLQHYMDDLHLSEDDCLTIGDGANDLPMLKILPPGPPPPPPIRRKINNHTITIIAIKKCSATTFQTCFFLCFFGKFVYFSTSVCYSFN